MFKGRDIDRYLKSIYAEQELTEKFPEKKKLERLRKNIEKERKCLHDIFLFLTFQSLSTYAGPDPRLDRDV